MPYISIGKREEIDPRLCELVQKAEEGCFTAGDLNYIFTRLALAYVKDSRKCYQTFNDVVGALEGAKLELYRRHVAPYEDKKISQNGDVS